MMLLPQQAYLARLALTHPLTSAGAIKMACVLCHKTRVTRAFLPCEHAAVCDGCMEKNEIGPMRSHGNGVGAQLASGKGPGRGKVRQLYSMCEAWMRVVRRIHHSP